MLVFRGFLVRMLPFPFIRLTVPTLCQSYLQCVARELRSLELHEYITFVTDSVILTYIQTRLLLFMLFICHVCSVRMKLLRISDYTQHNKIRRSSCSRSYHVAIYWRIVKILTPCFTSVQGCNTNASRKLALCDIECNKKMLRVDQTVANDILWTLYLAIQLRESSLIQ